MDFLSSCVSPIVKALHGDADISVVKTHIKHGKEYGFNDWLPLYVVAETLLKVPDNTNVKKVLSNIALFSEELGWSMYAKSHR